VARACRRMWSDIRGMDMAALQTTGLAASADGRLEMFVPCVGPGDPVELGNEGPVQLWHLYQMTPAGAWSDWVSHGCPPGTTEPFVGTGPLVTRNIEGRLDLIMGFGATSPDGPFHITQTAPNNGWTPTWTSLDLPPGTTSVNNYALATRHYGDLELFAVSGNYGSGPGNFELWHLGQTSGADWLRWSSLGCPPPGGPLAPAVAASADGRLEVFTVAADGALWHIWETTLNGTWSNWMSHGQPQGSLGLNGTPVIAANSEGRLELLLTGNDSQLWHIWQTAPSQGWSPDWLSHGEPPGGFFSSSAMAASVDGRLELFATGADQQLWHINQLTPSGSWSGWYTHGRPVDSTTAPVGAGGTPTVALNSANRLELFLAGTNNELWHIWQTTPGGPWSSWYSHGKPTGFYVFPPWV
jgi:hypothetical protein